MAKSAIRKNNEFLGRLGMLASFVGVSLMHCGMCCGRFNPTLQDLEFNSAVQLYCARLWQYVRKKYENFGETCLLPGSVCQIIACSISPHTPLDRYSPHSSYSYLMRVQLIYNPIHYFVLVAKPKPKPDYSAEPAVES
jgi:hypothetical protein